MRHENVMLQRNFSEQERQLEETQEKLKVLLKDQQQAGVKNSPKNEYVTASQVSNSKFVELSKKLREKTSEVECLKNRCSKLEAELSECHFSETDDGKLGNSLQLFCNLFSLLNLSLRTRRDG